MSCTEKVIHNQKQSGFFLAHPVYIYINFPPNLIWPVSLHYLVESGCSKFLPNPGFVTIRLLRFGVKVKMA